MKEILIKAFRGKSFKHFVLGIIVILLLEFAIFPALAIANTFLNLVGGGIVLGILIFIYGPIKKNIQNIVPKELPEGETEFDYINPKDLKPKRKKSPKQVPGVKSEGLFIKTKKNK